MFCRITIYTYFFKFANKIYKCLDFYALKETCRRNLWGEKNFFSSFLQPPTKKIIFSFLSEVFGDACRLFIVFRIAVHKRVFPLEKQFSST